MVILLLLLVGPSEERTELVKRNKKNDRVVDDVKGLAASLPCLSLSYVLPPTPLAFLHHSRLYLPLSLCVAHRSCH
jgi:hypothetical protein